MARIDLDITEYQGMRDKIKNLESALNLVSKEAAHNKEIIEQAKTLVEDLHEEGLLNRMFKWKSIIEPLLILFNI